MSNKNKSFFVFYDWKAFFLNTIFYCDRREPWTALYNVNDSLEHVILFFSLFFDLKVS